MSQNTTGPHVALFVTCLVDSFRPVVGFATVRLLELAGCRVEVPENQTCCGQPGFNSGDREGTRALARLQIEALEGFEYVVSPSGSCTAMLRHYPELFPEEDPWHARARALAGRAFEITSFLTDVIGLDRLEMRAAARITYHDSCSGLRKLGIKAQPRKLLAQLEGVEIAEMNEAETCCGFGGTFCVKYPEISNRMVSDKVANAEATGADLLLGGDLGCLLNMAGKLRREGSPLQVRHVVELLAGMTDTPPIGAGADDLFHDAGGR